jgi:hypothetical protein
MGGEVLLLCHFFGFLRLLRDFIMGVNWGFWVGFFVIFGVLRGK